MQAKAHDVVDELAKYGIHVSEGLVSRVKLDQIRSQQKIVRTALAPKNRPTPRNRWQKIPQKRPWRRET
jgi:hypothetical protein